MKYALGKRSLERLEGVHPDLLRVVKRAIEISRVDFTVLEGLRTKERRRKLMEAGSSWTMSSRHLTGHAVDLGAWVDNQIDWSWPLYDTIAVAMKQASQELEIPIKWGGDWVVKDGPHFELDRKVYP